MEKSKFNQLVITFEGQIRSESNPMALYAYGKAFMLQIHHPYFAYRIGETFIAVFNDKILAREFLIQGAEFSVELEGQAIDEIIAHSIGMCQWLLLDNYHYKASFNEMKYKLYAQSYYFLSYAISRIGNTANDSLRTRGLLLRKPQDKDMVLRMLKTYYYNGNDLCIEILTLSDFHYAALEFNNMNMGNAAFQCQEWAKQDLQKILSLPQYQTFKMLDINAIAKISKQNQDYLYNKIEKAFRDKVFSLSYTTSSFFGFFNKKKTFSDIITCEFI